MAASPEQIVLLHLSDLHLGPGPVESVLHPISGWRKHDLRLCLQLRDTMEQVLAAFDCDERSLWVLVSGDLTGSGGASEFAVAHTLLRSEWLLFRSRSPRTGLGLPDDHCLTLPGNHDHWCGAEVWPPRAYNRSISGMHFQPTPWRVSLHSPGGRLRVELFAVDSCSGVANWLTNPFAEGALSPEEWKKLGELLTESQTGSQCVRAILCHHSLGRHGSFSLTRPLRASCREQLLRIAAQQKVRALLTGHAHAFKMAPYVEQTTGKRIWELRSPTTLQAPAEVGRQGFWVHHITLPDARPVWSATLFVWDGRRFAPLHKIDVD